MREGKDAKQFDELALLHFHGEFGGPAVRPARLTPAANENGRTRSALQPFSVKPGWRICAQRAFVAARSSSPKRFSSPLIVAGSEPKLVQTSSSAGALSQLE